MTAVNARFARGLAQIDRPNAVANLIAQTPRPDGGFPLRLFIDTGSACDQVQSQTWKFAAVTAAGD